MVSGSLPVIIRGFKSAVTKRINEMCHIKSKPVWQRNYYEHIISSENEYQSIVDYIDLNPIKWEYDIEKSKG